MGGNQGVHTTRHDIFFFGEELDMIHIIRGIMERRFISDVMLDCYSNSLESEQKGCQKTTTEAPVYNVQQRPTSKR
jgi:hypothetical protein